MCLALPSSEYYELFRLPQVDRPILAFYSLFGTRGPTSNLRGSRVRAESFEHMLTDDIPERRTQGSP